MGEMCSPRISVLTATLNAHSHLEQLYQSLCDQTDVEFEWIVTDGGSVDGTLGLLRCWSEEHSWVKYTSEPDFGFYHALNRAVRLAEGEYYIVAGADDYFAADALANYAAHSDGCDVLLARVLKSGEICGGFYPRRAWLGHQQVFGGSHSVGMMFRRSLHQQHGYYSHRFPLLADGFFLKKLLCAHVRFREAEFVAGVFAVDGISNTGKLQSLAETWQIQVLTEKSVLLQTALLVFKLLGRLGIVKGECSRSVAKLTQVRRGG